MEEMTPTEKIQVEALAKWKEKLKLKGLWDGWKRDKTIEPYKRENETMIIVLLDKRNKRHWLQISPAGEITFAPTSMRCI